MKASILKPPSKVRS